MVSWLKNNLATKISDVYTLVQKNIMEVSFNPAAREDKMICLTGLLGVHMLKCFQFFRRKI